MDRCYVTAVVSPKPGMADRVKAEILANMPNVRKEQGCLRYDLHVLKKDGGAFLFYEIWANQAALDAHAKAPHQVAYRERTRDLLAAPTQVSVWSGVAVAE